MILQLLTIYDVKTIKKKSLGADSTGVVEPTLQWGHISIHRFRGLCWSVCDWLMVGVITAAEGGESGSGNDMRERPQLEMGRRGAGCWEWEKWWPGWTNSWWWWKHPKQGVFGWELHGCSLEFIEVFTFWEYSGHELSDLGLIVSWTTQLLKRPTPTF